jgi:hypothetical protein
VARPYTDDLIMRPAMMPAGTLDVGGGFRGSRTRGSALIIAITEPDEYRVSARGSEKLREFPSNHRRQTAS